MIKGYKDNAYPILSGKALVKVSLRAKESRSNFYDEIIKKIRYSFIRMNTNSLFVNPMAEHISMVRLERSTDRKSRYCNKSYEYNLIEDAVNPWQKFKLAAGGVVAASILTLSTFGMLGKGEINSSQNLRTPGINVSGNEQELSSGKSQYQPFVVSLSDKENIIMASLSNPMENYPFKSRSLGDHTNTYSPGHTNILNAAHTNITAGNGHTNVFPDTHTDSGGHTNISGDNTHTNIGPTDPNDPNTGHTNLGGQHTNATHTNYSGHNNGTEHTNVYDPNNG